VGFWSLSIDRYPKEYKKKFHKLGPLPSSGEGGGRHLLCCVRWKELNLVLRLRSAISNGPNRVRVSHSHLRTETDPVPETLRSFVFSRTPRDGQSPETQYSWMLYTNPLESTWRETYKFETRKYIEQLSNYWFIKRNTDPRIFLFRHLVGQAVCRPIWCSVFDKYNCQLYTTTIDSAACTASWPKLVSVHAIGHSQ
jgi:hypothetical protein